MKHFLHYFFFEMAWCIPEYLQQVTFKQLYKRKKKLKCDLLEVNFKSEDKCQVWYYCSLMPTLVTLEPQRYLRVNTVFLAHFSVWNLGSLENVPLIIC